MATGANRAKFCVTKPVQPRFHGVERAVDGRVRVTWPRSAGDMLIFGSDRLDFLLEAFADWESTMIENNTIRESRAAGRCPVEISPWRWLR